MTASARKPPWLAWVTAVLLPAAFVACGSPRGGMTFGPLAPTSSASGQSAPAAEEAAPGSEPSAKASPQDSTAWPFGPAPSGAELQAQVERLGKDQGPVKSNWTPPGKTERYGHAEALIPARYEAVKERLLDFPHYRELAGPKFKKVSVVDKSTSGTDVYFQLPIMKGVVTIWYVTRFAAPRPAMGGGEIVEGRFVKGNIKDMQIVFTIRPAGEDRTIFVCDLSLAIKLPAPQSALDEELRDACGDAANAVRARVIGPVAGP